MSLIRPVCLAIANCYRSQVEASKTASTTQGYRIPLEKMYKSEESTSSNPLFNQGRVVKIDSNESGKETIDKCKSILSRFRDHFNTQSTTAAEVVELLYQ